MTEEILSSIKFHRALDIISDELKTLTNSPEFAPFNKLKDSSYLRDHPKAMQYIYIYLEALKETSFITDSEYISLLTTTTSTFENI